MLPTLRLLIAAMLATVVVLICGFGIFAAFRVSRDPIAHLPAAAAPLQMVAEAGAASFALSAGRDGAEQRSQFDVPMNAPQEAAPAAPLAEQHAKAELAADEPPTAQSPSATREAEPSADRDPENESVASTPPEQPSTADPLVGQLEPSPVSGGRHGDVAQRTASGFSLPRPREAAAEPPVTAIDQAIDTTAATPTAPAEDAPGRQPTFAQTSAGKAFAALNAETESAVDFYPAVKPLPDGAVDRSGPVTQPKPALAPARRGIGHAPPAISRIEPLRRIERPVRTLSATTVAKPKRARVAVGRPVRILRLTASYYGQYAQSADQSYGYGQGDAQGAAADQQQAAVRYVVRRRALAARKINSAVGGPFVRAGTQ
jgi:hypothetical protein